MQMRQGLASVLREIYGLWKEALGAAPEGEWN